MKKILFALVIVAACFTSNATIVYTDNSSGPIVKQQSNLYIDFNNDGIDDAGVYFPAYLTAYSKFGSGTAYVSEITGVKALDQWHVINSTDSFSKDGDSQRLHEPNNHWWTSIGKVAYLGLKFEVNNETHYGWIRGYLISDVSMKVTGWAYETTAGKSITAGVGPSGPVGIPDLSIESINIYPNPANQFVNIDNASNQVIDEIVLYSIDGKIRDSFEGTTNRISISSYNQGQYFMVLYYQKNAILTKKILIN